MTALISAYARWYHSENNSVTVFDDSFAGKILSDDEKTQISLNMSKGIGFFCPGFHGTEDEALRWIVDNQLSPTTLGRSAWAEKALHVAVKIGVKQYLVIAAGYDTFAYRQPEWASDLSIFEFDTIQMITDKQKRVSCVVEQNPHNLKSIQIDFTQESVYEKLLNTEGFDHSVTSFCSLLGLAYYLSADDFEKLIRDIARSLAKGSTIAFDYPDEYTFTEQAGEQVKKQSMLASSAGEAMLAGYSYDDVEQMLTDCGFLIYEHVTPNEITAQYFSEYNLANPQNKMTASDNVNYCLAVRK